MWNEGGIFAASIHELTACGARSTIVEECYDLSRVMDGLERYFDYEAYARDLFMYDYSMGANGNVFRCH